VSVDDPAPFQSPVQTTSAKAGAVETTTAITAAAIDIKRSDIFFPSLPVAYRMSLYGASDLNGLLTDRVSLYGASDRMAFRPSDRRTLRTGPRRVRQPFLPMPTPGRTVP